MMLFLARRTAALVVAVLLASFVVFLIPYVTPGDPVRKIIRSRVAGDAIDDSAVEALTLQLGLQDPLWTQYLRWLGRLRQRRHGPVLHQPHAGGRPGAARPLGHAQPGGHDAGRGGPDFRGPRHYGRLNEGRAADKAITAVSQAFIAMPEYWLAPMLVLVFALELSVLPSAGWEGPTSAVLPVAVLALRPASHFTSAVREGMLDALGADHVAAARGRGLSHFHTVRKHVIPNGLLPLTTLVAVWFAGLLGGSVIVEVIFAIPGMGRLLFDGVLNSDIPLAQGAVVVVVGLAVLLTTAADLVHGLLNPQVRMRHA